MKIILNSKVNSLWLEETVKRNYKNGLNSHYYNQYSYFLERSKTFRTDMLYINNSQKTRYTINLIENI